MAKPRICSMTVIITFNVVELANRTRISFYCDALGTNTEIVDVMVNSQYRKYNLLGDVQKAVLNGVKCH